MPRRQIGMRQKAPAGNHESQAEYAPAPVAGQLRQGKAEREEPQIDQTRPGEPARSDRTAEKPALRQQGRSDSRIFRWRGHQGAIAGCSVS